MELAVILTMIALSITIGGVLVGHERRFHSLVTRVAVIERQVEPFWDFLRANLGVIWRSSEAAGRNPPSHDRISRLSAGAISLPEMAELETELTEALHCGEQHDPLTILFTLWVLRLDRTRLNNRRATPTE